VYGGRITGGSDGRTGALVKVGTGTSTFTGTGSSFNNLRVDAGTLRLSGGSLQLNSATRGGDMALLVHSRLEVLDGAVLSANAAGDSTMVVDGLAGTQLLVDGTGSRLDTGFQALVGLTTQGELTLRNGGTLQGGFAVVAGTLDGSRGQLNVESGGRLSAPLVGLGMLAGAQGSALVSGSGSELRATAELGIGGVSSGQNGGTGTLTLRNGGQAVAPRTVFWTDGSRARIDGGQLQAGALVGSAAGSEIELVADPTQGLALVLDSSTGSHRFDGRISGAGGVLKRGAGTQQLLGGNSFSGAVRVEGGTLQMASSRASDYEVRAGAQLQLGERNLGAAVVQALPGATVVYTGASLAGGQLLGGGTHDVSAVQRIVGTQLGVGSTLRPADGATLVGVANSGHLVNVAGRSLVWTGGGNGVGTFTVAGNTTVSAFSSAGVIELQPGATLTSTGTDLMLAAGSRTLIGSAAVPGGLLRLADGSRVQLNGGLLVNNGHIDGALHVGYGGLAKGAGSFGAVTVADGGRFSPGNSPGTARSSTATWGAGGGLVVELAAATGTAGVHWDLWQIDGLLDITAGTSANSRFTLSVQTLAADGTAGPLAGFDPMQPWQWLIVDTGAGITGFDPGRLTLDLSGFGSLTAGGSFALAVSDGDLFLQFAPVPEPGTWAQLLGGLAGLGWLVARRGRRA
jgi:autotransporter-associated beta strand protein